MLRLALAMLLNDYRKYASIVFGLTFTSFMMSFQPASFLGALNSVANVVDQVGSIDLWVTEPSLRALTDFKPLADSMLYRVQGVAGVAWAVPFHKGSLRVRLADGSYQDCTFYGVDDTTLIGSPANMTAGRLTDLRQGGALLVDAASAKVSGPLAVTANGKRKALRIGDTLDIEDGQATIVGLHGGPTSPDQLPTLFATYSHVKQYTSQRKTMSYVLVKLKAGANVAAVKAELLRFTGLTAYSPAELKQKTLDYFLWKSGALISFGLVSVITFGIGASIAAQSFAAFARDSLRYFGVLKAMGASRTQLISMILAQALLVAAIGFGIGVGVTVLFGALIQNGSGIDFPMSVTPALLAFTATCVHAVCLGSALLSIARVLRLEPAAVFRS
jgi:putative ABC transport system permease protein